jgi:hypothetical protein
VDSVAGDLLGAFGRAGQGAGQAAGVADRGGAGVQQADEGADVAGFPCPLEGPDDGGLPGGGSRGGLRGADAAAGRGASWRQAAGVRPTILATSAKA